MLRNKTIQAGVRPGLRGAILLVPLCYAALLAGCETRVVRVVDSRTGLPVPGATVTSRSGPYETAPHYTGWDGSTARPTLPIRESELVVRRPGYATTEIER